MVRAQEVVSEAAPRRRSEPSALALQWTPARAAGRLSPAAILMLQSSAGNAAVAGLLRRRNEEAEDGAAQACSCDEGTAPESMCPSCSAARGSEQGGSGGGETAPPSQTGSGETAPP